MSTSTEVQQYEPGAVGLVQKYEQAFAGNLPTHINRDQWLSVIYGELRSKPEIAAAANNNPGKFMYALLNCARLGLEPGLTFHFVPQSPKKGAPKEILGVVDYKGLVELIYRAGAVSSVIVECVFTNDSFEYTPGRDERPLHRIDWMADSRGDLALVYAYAVMKDGATSKVIVLNRTDIARIMQSSASARSEYSPWAKHPASMWMKSAARQLAKWVPTSAEYRRQQLRDVQFIADDADRRSAVVEFPDMDRVDPLTGEVDESESEPIDAEVVGDETA